MIATLENLAKWIDELAGDIEILRKKVNNAGGDTVTITPALESGTKIADYTIGENEGSLFAPTQTSEYIEEVLYTNASGVGGTDQEVTVTTTKPLSDYDYAYVKIAVFVSGQTPERFQYLQVFQKVLTESDWSNAVFWGGYGNRYAKITADKDSTTLKVVAIAPGESSVVCKLYDIVGVNFKSSVTVSTKQRKRGKINEHS